MTARVADNLPSCNTRNQAFKLFLEVTGEFVQQSGPSDESVIRMVDPWCPAASLVVLGGS